jgi:hypothetical protein
MQALFGEVINLKKTPNPKLQIVVAALDAFNNAEVQFGVEQLVPLEFLRLIFQKFPEAAELLPFIDAAINELSVACFQKDCERHGLKHAMILYRATIVSCVSIRATMSSKDFMVAISIVPIMCMPLYDDAVHDMSIIAISDILTYRFDAMARERLVAFACMEICAAVQLCF